MQGFSHCRVITVWTCVWYSVRQWFVFLESGPAKTGIHRESEPCTFSLYKSLPFFPMRALCGSVNRAGPKLGKDENVLRNPWRRVAIGQSKLTVVSDPYGIDCWYQLVLRSLLATTNMRAKVAWLSEITRSKDHSCYRLHARNVKVIPIWDDICSLYRECNLPLSLEPLPLHFNNAVMQTTVILIE